MSNVDIVISLVVLSGTWKCWRSGLAKSVWGLMAIFAGVWAASQFWRDIAPNLEPLIGGNPELAKWVSVIGIAATVSIAAAWLLERMQGIFDKGVLGWVNGLAGAVFGMFVGIFLTGGICLLVSSHGSENIKSVIEQSHLAELTMSFARQFLDFGKEAINKQVYRMR